MSATNSYGQPEKNRARTFLIESAITALTDDRQTSPLVTVEGFDGMLKYCLDQAAPYFQPGFRAVVRSCRKEWTAIHGARVGNRKRSELKVLFLSGPEPLNDLLEFGRLGVLPANIWAIEGDKRTFYAAVEQLHKARLPVKLHFGSLHEFFTVVPEQFDIVYFDACGPLFSRESKPHRVIRELFLHQRLAPLSALITNYACTPRDNEEEWVNRFVAWYAPRHEQPAPDDDEELIRVNDQSKFRRHITRHLESYYSDFVTRFSMEFSTHLVPWWRVWALNAAKRMYFSDDKMRAKATKAALQVGEKQAEHENQPIEDEASVEAEEGKLADIDDKLRALLDSIGHAQLSPSSYPYLVLSELAKEHLAENDPVRGLLFNEGFHSTKLADAIAAVSLMRCAFDGRFKIASHNWDAFSEDLKKMLNEFKWFDSEGAPLHRLFCDTPFDNLVVDLLLGIYGYPYHTNSEKLRRIKYRAKKTTMYSDMVVLDQCRYFYDFAPTLPLFTSALSIDVQLVLRICMDQIRRHTYAARVDLFHGSSLAGLWSSGFSSSEWRERQTLRQVTKE